MAANLLKLLPLPRAAQCILIRNPIGRLFLYHATLHAERRRTRFMQAAQTCSMCVVAILILAYMLGTYRYLRFA